MKKLHNKYSDYKVSLVSVNTAASLIAGELHLLKAKYKTESRDSSLTCD